MKILIIEDDKKTSNLLKDSLKKEFFTVDLSETGDDGIYIFQTNTYDLILVDYNLPGKNGDEVITEIRKENKKVPIIALTVEAEQSMKNKLFNMEIDDYITKPFIFEDLLTRIKAVMRRPREIKSQIYKIDDLFVDVEKHAVKRGKNKIYLTFKELMLLEYFLKNQGKILSRTVLMENVWDFNADPFSNTIESHILKIRKKINPNKDKRDLIHTIKGRGYKLDLSKW
ncbi:DNA-binding response regulator [Candidatus Falkowbacteria bacterium HGW-Falkowbacteria-1]|jgi:DNA-binding response OmpR family regulator|uniref:DNA-binding response regulator n=1 Tax=Candidatus Falkowbacteria bacterium HGW-Falkowbacteria-1 TaxID=2013768 RepID=A0A2N2E9H9_9BACT|nr:MAG: DNA-binding response regulator [Candidatus Falkowbacteria bacterium HGW-Falkowbacteria-1]